MQGEPQDPLCSSWALASLSAGTERPDPSAAAGAPGPAAFSSAPSVLSTEPERAPSLWQRALPGDSDFYEEIAL